MCESSGALSSMSFGSRASWAPASPVARSGAGQHELCEELRRELRSGLRRELQRELSASTSEY